MIDGAFRERFIHPRKQLAQGPTVTDALVALGTVALVKSLDVTV
jgi:hypothetical protein